MVARRAHAILGQLARCMTVRCSACTGAGLHRVAMRAGSGFGPMAMGCMRVGVSSMKQSRFSCGSGQAHARAEGGRVVMRGLRDCVGPVQFGLLPVVIRLWHAPVAMRLWTCGHAPVAMHRWSCKGWETRQVLHSSGCCRAPAHPHCPPKYAGGL